MFRRSGDKTIYLVQTQEQFELYFCSGCGDSSCMKNITTRQDQIQNETNAAGLVRLSRELNAIAAETMECERIGAFIYAFGSELATLRILKVYRDSKNARQGFSHARKSFYFSIEPKV